MLLLILLRSNKTLNKLFEEDGNMNCQLKLLRKEILSMSSNWCFKGQSILSAAFPLLYILVRVPTQNGMPGQVDITAQLGAKSGFELCFCLYTFTTFSVVTYLCLMWQLLVIQGYPSHTQGWYVWNHKYYIGCRGTPSSVSLLMLNSNKFVFFFFSWKGSWYDLLLKNQVTAVLYITTASAIIEPFDIVVVPFLWVKSL